MLKCVAIFLCFICLRRRPHFIHPHVLEMVHRDHHFQSISELWHCKLQFLILFICWIYLVILTTFPPPESMRQTFSKMWDLTLFDIISFTHLSFISSIYQIRQVPPSIWYWGNQELVWTRLPDSWSRTVFDRNCRRVSTWYHLILIDYIKYVQKENE